MSVPAWLDSDTQERADRFYWENGPCCAGCDWWRWVGSSLGECLRNAPVSATERMQHLGMSGCSLPPEAGHILTRREHHCGDFKDEFDWSSLPLAYLKSIGAPLPAPPAAPR